MNLYQSPHKIIDKKGELSISEIPGLKEVEAKLQSVLLGADGIIKDMCISLLNSGGKRLRPLMVIYSGLCFSKLTEEMVNAAVAAELIHMASLVHDDIIDESESRRGKMTMNAVYGNHTAVLAGDYIFAKAFAILSSFKLLKSMEYLVEAIQGMCDGEVNQAEDNFNIDVTVDGYFDRIYKKTGILISSCCRAGAAAAGASDKEIDIMKEYGVNVGYAFQIIDDVLDFIGDEQKLGKPAGMDLINGNITLPVILLMEDEDMGPWVKEIIKKGVITRKEFNSINGVLKESGAVAKSYAIAEKCIAKAKSSIYSIPDSPFREVLLNIADKVISRKN